MGGELPLATVAPALAQPGRVHTKGRNKGLWDHRGEHPTQGEDQERLPRGGDLLLGLGGDRY